MKVTLGSASVILKYINGVISRNKYFKSANLNFAKWKLERLVFCKWRLISFWHPVFKSKKWRGLFLSCRAKREGKLWFVQLYDIKDILFKWRECKPEVSSDNLTSSKMLWSRRRYFSPCRRSFCIDEELSLEYRKESNASLENPFCRCKLCMGLPSVSKEVDWGDPQSYEMIVLTLNNLVRKAICAI